RELPRVAGAPINDRWTGPAVGQWKDRVQARAEGKTRSKHRGRTRIQQVHDAISEIGRDWESVAIGARIPSRMLSRLIIPTAPQKNPGGPTKVVVRAATIAGRQGFARGFENERNGQQSSRQLLSIASTSIQNFDDPIAPELCFVFEGPVLENCL